jgi:hypothetical protein
MNRGWLTRRFAAAILISFSALIAVALAPLVYNAVSNQDLDLPLGVQALQSDSVIVDLPIRLSVLPDITVTSGKLSLAKVSGSKLRIVTLQSAIFEVGLGALDGAKNLGADPMPLVFAPLIENLSALAVDRILLRNATLVLNWGKGRSIKLGNVTADIVVKDKAYVSAAGSFSYLLHPFSFDAHLAPTIDAISAAEPDREGRWPLRLNVSSPVFGLGFDGVVDIGRAWSLKGQTDVRTPDLASLATALGYGAVDTETAPAVLVKGLARWADGAIDFGKSQISLGDQEGVGALALRLRDGRPGIEATIAFPALDVAPLLQRASKSGAPAGSTPWHALATSFPAIGRIDAELRLSAKRLQWNGAPIGTGAVSVTARDGRLHGDFAELDLGSLVGNIQISIDETVPGAPVAMRGKLESADISAAVVQLFGAELLRGRAQSQIEFVGFGRTLGDVVKNATMRGAISMREGQMPLDLAAALRIAQSSQSAEPIVGWGELTPFSEFDACTIKFHAGDGAVVIERGEVRSRGVLAVAHGRIGLARSDVDMWLQVAKEAQGRSGSTRLGPTQVPWRDSLSIRGAWAAPLIARGDSQALLP